MKLHGNRACFHAGLKSQTGMSSFRLSCERTLSFRFQCSDRSITYYRETKRHLKVKVGEHIIVSALIGERDSNKKNVLKNHCLLSGHACSFNYFINLEDS